MTHMDMFYIMVKRQASSIRIYFFNISMLIIYERKGAVLMPLLAVFDTPRPCIVRACSRGQGDYANSTKSRNVAVFIFPGTRVPARLQHVWGNTNAAFHWSRAIRVTS